MIFLPLSECPDRSLDNSEAAEGWQGTSKKTFGQNLKNLAGEAFRPKKQTWFFNNHFKYNKSIFYYSRLFVLKRTISPCHIN